ncbi:hypothetical protein EDC01DRAFT_11747 [Geopyxis carbonaria]|nr:hypothetical protein EDC01DRAFT_11747 [Geopyxis carbonaria]
MSLEGLDSAPLLEAFENAQTEPGGWFWIKYTSRDEVELLTRGNNGAEEMRAIAVDQPDDSPLYGFIRFRRRSVLVKLIPEGTSRVLKARSQVHFQLVAEKFSPHDTTYTIVSPKELTDSGLNSACSTHTQTASISSSNSSLRQRRLADIAESTDECDEPTPRNVHGSPRAFGQFGEPAAKSDIEGGQGLAVVVTTHDTGVSDPGGNGSGGGAGDPAIPFRGDNRDPTAAFLLPSAKSPFDSIEPRRKSTSSARPSISSDIYSYYPYVPKVKLGPRPHVGDAPKRPHTSNDRSKAFQASVEELRASIPRSVHIPPRRSAVPPRTKSNSPTIPTLEIPQPPQSPVTPSTPTSVVSLPIPSLLHSPPSHAKSNSADGGLTPEKQRLMKALQLRKKNQIAAEQKDQKEKQVIEEKKNEQTSSPTESADSNASDEKTPTASNMPVNTNETNSLNAEGKEDERGVDLYAGERGGLLDEETKLETDVTTLPETSANASVIAKAEEPTLYTETFDEMQDTKKEKGPVQEGTKEEGTVEESQSPVYEEHSVEPEVVTVNEEPSTPLDNDADKVEGTKVRDDVNSEDENDTESIRSMDVSMNDSRPVTMQSLPTVQTIQVPAIAKSMHQTDRPKKITQPEPSPPKAIKRVERTSEIPSNETPVIETARSVSAPFLKTARVQVPRKVNVAGGSVSQRIRQFQQLAAIAPKSFAPPRTPSRSRSNSPTPEWANRSASLQKTPPPAFRKNSISSSSQSERTPPKSSPAPSVHRSPTPPPPPPKDEPAKIEFVNKDDRPQLQVTTKINREESKIHVSPTTICAKQPSPETAPEATAPVPIPEPPMPTLRRRSVDISSVVDLVKPRRTNTDQSSKSRRSSVDKEREEKSERPRLFSRTSSNKDLGELTEGAVASSSRRSSTSSPNSSSPKSSNFLKRVSSSLSRKKDSSPPPPPLQPPAPVEPAKKSYLLAGWINVQLPDTMLWRRRCMKIDSNGWLFLSLTDDETAPQTRRYYIPSEVRKVDLPDVDDQELPHSVRLMLQEGGMLQCACQNSGEQKEVLSVVRGCVS